MKKNGIGCADGRRGGCRPTSAPSCAARPPTPTPSAPASSPSSAGYRLPLTRERWSAGTQASPNRRVSDGAPFSSHPIGASAGRVGLTHTMCCSSRTRIDASRNSPRAVSSRDATRRSALSAASIRWTSFSAAGPRCPDTAAAARRRRLTSRGASHEWTLRLAYIWVSHFRDQPDRWLRHSWRSAAVITT